MNPIVIMSPLLMYLPSFKMEGTSTTHPIRLSDADVERKTTRQRASNNQYMAICVSGDGAYSRIESSWVIRRHAANREKKFARYNLKIIDAAKLNRIVRQYIGAGHY
jgi:hypothetical protein